jgi:hypothetical protein
MTQPKNATGNGQAGPAFDQRISFAVVINDFGQGLLISVLAGMRCQMVGDGLEVIELIHPIVRKALNWPSVC